MFALPPLAAEKIFNIGPVPVTNTMVNSFAALIIFVVAAYFINRGVKKYYSKDKAPSGILNFFESILDFLLSQIDNVTKDRKKTLKFLPIVGTLFFFILISNWMGLIPGTGSIGIWQPHHGEMELIPLFR